MLTHKQVLHSYIGNATIKTTGFSQEELDKLFSEFLPEGVTTTLDYKLLVQFVDFLNKNHCTSNERSAYITIT